VDDGKILGREELGEPLLRGHRNTSESLDLCLLGALALDLFNPIHSKISRLRD
jgi:hypothetical protein